MQCHQNTNYPVFISLQGLVVSSIIIRFSWMFLIGVMHLSAILFPKYLSGVTLGSWKTSSAYVAFYPRSIFYFCHNVHYWTFLQSLTDYLRQTLDFMWNNTLRENFNFYFPRDFSWYWQNFPCGRRNTHYAIILWSLGVFLIFPSFLRSYRLFIPKAWSRLATCEVTRID